MPGFADYEKATERVIPVVELRPTPEFPPTVLLAGVPAVGGVWCSGSTVVSRTERTTTCPTSPLSCPLRAPATGPAQPRPRAGGSLVPAAFRVLLRAATRTGRPMGSGRAAVAGFDLTFSAPKSASVLFALGGAEAAAASPRSTRRGAGALSYLERHAVPAVRRSTYEPSGPDHRDRRRAVHPRGQPQRGPAPAQPRRHGQPRPRRGRPLGCLRPARAPPIGQLHRRSTGRTCGRVDRGPRRALGGRARSPAEIVGVAPELLGEFSSRAADIRRHMHEFGADSGPGSPRGLGGHPAGQDTGAALRRSGPRVDPTGRAVGGTWELAPPVGRAGLAPGTRSARRAPLCRCHLAHPSRRRAAARRRGGVR